MSKPFKMRSGNSPIFKRIGGSSPMRAAPDPAGVDYVPPPAEIEEIPHGTARASLTDEQIIEYLGDTKRDIKEKKRRALESSRRMQKSATGSRSGKKGQRKS